MEGYGILASRPHHVPTSRRIPRTARRAEIRIHGVGRDRQYATQRVALADGQHRGELGGWKFLISVEVGVGGITPVLRAGMGLRTRMIGHGHAGEGHGVRHLQAGRRGTLRPGFRDGAVGTYHQIGPQQVQCLLVERTIEAIDKESDGGDGGHGHQQRHQQQIQFTRPKIPPQQQPGQAKGRNARGGSGRLRHGGSMNGKSCTVWWHRPAALATTAGQMERVMNSFSPALAPLVSRQGGPVESRPERHHVQARPGALPGQCRKRQMMIRVAR